MSKSVLRREFEVAFKGILQDIKARNKQQISFIIENIAKEIGVSEETIRGWYYRGKSPEYVQLRNLVRILKQEGASHDKLKTLLDTSGVEFASGSYSDEILASLFLVQSQNTSHPNDKYFGEKRKLRKSSEDSQIASILLEPYIILRPPKRHQFFVDLTDDIGREKNIRDILIIVTTSGICEVYGPPGFGKTAIVTEVIWRLFTGDTPPVEFPHGIIYHDFRQDESLERIYEKIVIAYNPTYYETEPRPTLETATALVLTQRQPLLVLDSLEDFSIYRRLRPILGSCPRIIVSRKAQFETREPVLIDKVTPSEAKQILYYWGQHWVGDDRVAMDLCKLAGFMPLAVEIIGTQLSHYNSRSKKKLYGKEMLYELQESSLAVLDFKQDPEGSVRELFKHFIAQFDEIARKALPLIGLLAWAPFNREVIAKVLAIPPREAQKALNRLVSYHWLDPIDKHLYEVHHDLMYEYAKELTSTIDTQDIKEALSNYYFSGTEEFYPPSSNNITWWNIARPHLVKILISDCEEKDDWLCVTFHMRFDAMRLYLVSNRHWSDIKVLSQAGLKTAQVQNDPSYESVWLGWLGEASYQLDSLEESLNYYQQVLTVTQSLPKDSLHIHALGMIGKLYLKMRQISTGISYIQQALSVARKLGDRYYEGLWLTTLAEFYFDLGYNELATEYYEQAYIINQLESNEDTGDNPIKLDVSYQDLNPAEKIIHYYLRAVGRAKEGGDDTSLTVNLANLAHSYLTLGRLEEAITYYQQTLEILQLIDDSKDKVIILSQLGIAYRRLGQLDRALDYHKQAVATAQELGNSKQIGESLLNLGNVYADLGETETAIDYYYQALTNLQEKGKHPGECLVLEHLGSSFCELGQFSKGIDYLYQALSMAQEIGDRRNEYECMGDLGKVHLKLGQVEVAIDYLHQALSMAQEVGDIFAEGAWLNDISVAYYQAGQLDLAFNSVCRSLPIVQQIGNPHSETVVKKSLKVIGENLARQNLHNFEIEKAKTIYYQLLTLIPNATIEAYLGLGVIAYIEWDDAAANQYLGTVLNRIGEVALICDQSYYSDLFHYKAVVHLLLGNLDRVVEYLNFAIENQPPQEPLNLTFFYLLSKSPRPPQYCEEILVKIDSFNKNESQG